MRLHFHRGPLCHGPHIETACSLPQTPSKLSRRPKKHLQPTQYRRENGRLGIYKSVDRVSCCISKPWLDSCYCQRTFPQGQPHSKTSGRISVRSVAAASWSAAVLCRFNRPSLADELILAPQQAPRYVGGYPNQSLSSSNFFSNRKWCVQGSIRQIGRYSH